MIPVLYAPTETQFNHMGIGALADTISAHVTEERNGSFELEFVYPVDGPLFDQIEKDCIVKAKANDDANMDPQLFRIYYISKPINGQVDFKAEHVSYELGKNPITSINVTGNAQAMLNAILSHTVFTHRFTAVSDDTTVLSSSLARVPARSAIGGTTGSLLDTWGGELTFDNWLIRHSLHRGTDTGIIVGYGKNLTDVTQEEAIDQTYTSIYPYANVQDAGGNQATIELPEKHIDSPYVSNFAYGRCLPVDLSGDDVTDVASLRTKAQAYVTQNDFGKPTVSLTIKFIQLWQTEEYKNIAPLEHINLCDWVTVRFKKLGIDVKAEVIKTDFDVLLEKYISVDLGDAKSNLADDLNGMQSNIADVSAAANQAVKTSGYALTQANGKNKSYYSATEPVGNLISGDLWYKIVNGQYTEMWRYNGISWDQILSVDANDAMNKAIDALTAANGKNTNYYQSAQPGTGNEGDTWFRENADGTITQFIYQSGQWVDPLDDGIKAAQDQADTAQSAADNAKTAADAAAQTASNAVSIGSAAQTAADNAASAASDAQNAANAAQTAAESAMSQALAANDAALAAQTSADGKSTISYGSTAPSNPKNGDTWFKDNGNGTTTIQQYINGSWEAPTDAAARSAQAAANAAQTAANNAASAASVAQTTANSASSAASAAQTTANGRNRILRQSTTPTGTFVTGDTWFDTANGNRVSVWNGSSWQLSQFGNAAVANLDAGAITTGTLAATRIAAGSIDVSKLVAGTLTSASGVFGTVDASILNTGTLNAARIGAGSIDASKLVAGAITATNGIIASIDASKITVGTLSANRIGASTITADKLLLGGNLADVVANKPIISSSGVSFISGGANNTSGTGIWQFSGTNPTLTIDLGANIPQIYNINFGTYYDGDWRFIPYGATLEWSTDNSTWTTFLTLANNTNTHINLTAGFQARYIKITVTAYQSGQTVANIANFHLMSAQGSTLIQGGQIVANSITATQIASATITASEIKAGTLTSASGVFGMIDASILTTGTLNAERIAAKSIDASKLVAGTLTSASGVFGTVDASILNAGTLNAARIGAGTIDASKLVAGTITAASGVISSIDAGKITTGTLDTNRIAAGSITANKLDVANLAAISANLGAVTAGTLTGVSINAATFTGGTYTGGTFTGSNIISTNGNSQKIQLSSGEMDFVSSAGQLIGSILMTYIPDTALNGVTFTTQTGNDYISIGYRDGNVFPETLRINTDGTAFLAGRGSLNIKVRDTATYMSEYDALVFTQKGATGSRYVQTDNYSELYMHGHSIWFNDAGTTDNHIYCTDGKNLIIGAAGAVNIGANGGYFLTGTAGYANLYGTLNMQGHGITNCTGVSQPSVADMKQDITVPTDSAIDIIKNTDFYQYRYISDANAGKMKYRYGVIIGADYRTPDQWLNEDGDGFDYGNSIFTTARAVKEEAVRGENRDILITALQAKVADLQNCNLYLQDQIDSLKNRVSVLEAA